jgi:hypothetical protein
MDSILNAIEQVLRSQLLTRQVHAKNKQTLNIVRSWTLSESKPAIPKDSLLQCIAQLDQMVGNCALTDYDHEFLINGFNTLSETINNHYKEKEVTEPQVQHL